MTTPRQIIIERYNRALMQASDIVDYLEASLLNNEFPHGDPAIHSFYHSFYHSFHHSFIHCDLSYHPSNVSLLGLTSSATTCIQACYAPLYLLRAIRCNNIYYYETAQLWYTKSLNTLPKASQPAAKQYMLIPDRPDQALHYASEAKQFHSFPLQPQYLLIS